MNEFSQGTAGDMDYIRKLMERRQQLRSQIAVKRVRGYDDDRRKADEVLRDVIEDELLARVSLAELRAQVAFAKGPGRRRSTDGGRTDEDESLLPS
jgi:hypothetical protein